MNSLIANLFEKSDIKNVIKLWQDQTSRQLIEEQVARKILESGNIIADLPFHQILALTSMATFANSIEERENAAKIIWWGLKRTDIVPFITEHYGKELAFRCFISLSFFKKMLEKRCERRGAPSPNFYRTIGIMEFRKINMFGISEHFEKWESFASEIFV